METRNIRDENGVAVHDDITYNQDELERHLRETLPGDFLELVVTPEGKVQARFRVEYIPF